MLKTSALALFVATLAITACSGDDSDSQDTDSTTTMDIESTDVATETTEASSATTEATESTEAAPETTEATPETTEATLPQPVDLEGSLQDIVSEREDLSNINAAIVAWLADDPGRDGVLRNARGVTLFLPNNDGFSDQDAFAAATDFDAFTIFLSEHLKVGAVASDQLGAGVSTAMGVEYPIGEGPTIGGRAILEADIEATNGVLYIIDGPLAPLNPAG